MDSLRGRRREAEPGTAAPADWSLRVLKLENRLQRERLARLEAEAIAEKGLRDLYDRHAALLGLLEAVAQFVNGGCTIEAALQFTLEAVCRRTGCQFGSVFLTDPADPTRLLPPSIFHAADPERLAAFAAASIAFGFRSESGLPGRILSTAQAHWTADVAADGDAERAAFARAFEFRAAFAYPVLAGSRIVAVMKFFHTERLEPDEALLALLAHVGSQVGRLIERKQAEERLIHDATHDPLTGLPNRALFASLLEDAAAAKDCAAPDAGFAVLFIDIDRFKRVNDSLGHAVGDAMLAEVARRFSSALGDVAQAGGTGATLARLGGDEFTVLVRGPESLPRARDAAERLLRSLDAPVQVAGHELHASASIGVAAGEAGVADAAAILRNADLAMYRAKGEGRSRVEVFDRSLHASAKRRLSLEHDLRQGIARDEFTLHFQPIVTLDDSRIVGFESLLRWEKDGRLVPPLDFIGVAEETGLIVPIGDWVLHESCRALASWQRIHPEWVRANGWRPLGVSINVSPRQFRQKDFASRVIAAVEANGVNPDSLFLEITEGMFMESTERSTASLHELREFGVHFSIDDFGTGYSSLSYLHRLPVDVIKVDRSFVNGLEGGTGNGPLVQAMLDMARNLDLGVVAEGVETRAQAVELDRMGCHYGQGYLFARPLPLSAATEALGARLPLPAGAR